MLPHPTKCALCIRLHLLAVSKVRSVNMKIPVLSWCRICGMPVLLEVLNDYDFANRHFHMLDDQPMAHKNVHAEGGGWGVHWRLDEVMVAVFGERHIEYCWPQPPWYEHQEALNLPVQILSNDELREFSKVHVDVEMRMLSEWVNRTPRSRDELCHLLSTDRVWGPREVKDDFEILGFKTPFAIAVERRTGRKGSMLFQHEPRLYFAFDPDRVI